MDGEHKPHETDLNFAQASGAGRENGRGQNARAGRLVVGKGHDRSVGVEVLQPSVTIGMEEWAFGLFQRLISWQIDGHGVDVLVVDPELVVQVWSSRQPGLAHFSDDLTLLDALATLDLDLA